MQKHCLYYLTFKCNAMCEFCDIWQNEIYQKTKETSLEKHFENLEKAKKEETTILEVTGGEPLLYEKLPEFLKEAKSKGFKIHLKTNGILYSQRAKEIQGLIDIVFFPLDYPDREEHNRSKGVECFNDVVSAIKLAAKTEQAVVVEFIVTRDSIRFLPDMIELAEKLGVKLDIHPVYDFHGLHGFEQTTYEYIKYYFKRKNVFINLAELEFVKNHGNNLAWPRCKAKLTTITFLPDGKRAEPCLFNQGGRQGKEAICYGCMRWPYMLPSFEVGFDKYRFLNWYSTWLNGQKEKKR